MIRLLLFVTMCFTYFISSASSTLNAEKDSLSKFHPDTVYIICDVKFLVTKKGKVKKSSIESSRCENCEIHNITESQEVFFHGKILEVIDQLPDLNKSNRKHYVLMPMVIKIGIADLEN